MRTSEFITPTTQASYFFSRSESGSVVWNADVHNTETPTTLTIQRSSQEEDMSLKMRTALDELDYAKVADWDGEGADPVDQSIIDVAKELARLMTGPVTSVGEAPEIYPTPRGEIDFSWNIDGRMLIIGICPPEPTIVYAGMSKDFDSRGRIAWAGILHPTVRGCIEALINPIA